VLERVEAMTESEWLVAPEVPVMLQFLGKKAGARKRRLFACACVRRIWHLLDDSRSQQAVEVGEEFAEGKVDKQLVKIAQRQAASAARLVAGRIWSGADAASNCALLSTEDISTAARAVAAASQAGGTVSVEREAQAVLVRDIFGNPFRSVVLDRTWLTPTVRSLATAAYEERVLPSGELDETRLAVLADALEEAGCTSADILTHLRGLGPHVRGCWAVDSLLGRS
jgi:hypothetical protein